MIKAIPDMIGSIIGVASGSNVGGIQDSFSNSEPTYPISVDLETVRGCVRGIRSNWLR